MMINKHHLHHQQELRLSEVQHINHIQFETELIRSKVTKHTEAVGATRLEETEEAGHPKFTAIEALC